MLAAFQGVFKNFPATYKTILKNPCSFTQKTRQKTLKTTFQFELNSHSDEV